MRQSATEPVVTVTNFSLFLTRLPTDGALYEFLYAEYRGTNYDADMAALAAEPRDIAWHKVCT